jgi:hypothetical protein
MEWIVVMAVLVVIVLVIRSVNQRQLREQEQVHRGFEQITAVKQATEDDLIALRLDLQKLDAELAGVELDDEAPAQYQRALDAREAVAVSLAAATSAAELANVTTIMHEGRYAIACVRARVDGTSPPSRRPPCFFDPRHGVSVRDVTWSPAGGSPRSVPACARDAEQVGAGAEPDVRTVVLGTQRVPYWQAGPSFGPWTSGYFGAFGGLNALFAGTMMGAVVSGGFDAELGGSSHGGGVDEGVAGGRSGGSDSGGGDLDGRADEVDGGDLDGPGDL